MQNTYVSSNVYKDRYVLQNNVCESLLIPLCDNGLHDICIHGDKPPEKEESHMTYKCLWKINIYLSKFLSYHLTSWTESTFAVYYIGQ